MQHVDVEPAVRAKLVERGVAQRRGNEKSPPLRGVPKKPSAGLEPATPSLPWTLEGAGEGMPRAV
jgi:hypothetical protein